MISRKEASELLQSRIVSDRLRAARYFQQQSKRKDVDFLTSLLEFEPDFWVRKSLEQAIEKHDRTYPRADNHLSPPEIASDTSEIETSAEALRHAIDHVLHDLAPPVGRVDFYAKKEIENYDTSETKKQVDALKTRFGSLRKLSEVANISEFAELELSQVVKRVITELESKLESIQLNGPKLFVVSDEDLLTTILCHGLQNAFEATESLPRDKRHISISWGKDSSGYWVRIVDNGSGPQHSLSVLKKPRMTTKKAHAGYGLSIASQAATSLNGEISLKKTASNGAIFEFRQRYPNEENSSINS